MVATLKFLLDYSNICVISVLACVTGLFLWNLRLSWFLVHTVIFTYILDILGIVLWDSESYLNLF